MGRSVSTHRDAVAKVFIEHGVDNQEDWHGFVDEVRSVVTRRFPSMSEAGRRWSGREDRIILENGVAEVSISDYCGLASVCLAPLRPGDPLCDGWCALVAANFEAELNRAFGGLRRVGFFSNGEAVYERAG